MFETTSPIQANQTLTLLPTYLLNSLILLSHTVLRHHNHFISIRESIISEFFHHLILIFRRRFYVNFCTLLTVNRIRIIFKVHFNGKNKLHAFFFSTLRCYMKSSNCQPAQYKLSETKGICTNNPKSKHFFDFKFVSK